MRTAVLAVLAAVLVVTGCAGAIATGAADRGYRSTDGRSEAQARADAAISGEINRLLVRDHSIPAMDIRVATYHGRVTLSGRVPDRRTAERALSLAASVPGVQAVVDRLWVD